MKASIAGLLFLPVVSVAAFSITGPQLGFNALRATSCGSKMPRRVEMTTTDAEVLFGDATSTTSSKLSSSRRVPRQEKLELGSLEYSSDPIVNDLRRMRDSVTSCPQLWSELGKLCGEKRALLDEHLCDETIDVTFAEMEDLVRRSASVFMTLGVKKGTNIAVLGENSARWLMVDHGIQLAGGASAVRGADAPPDELRYIYEHSDSAGVVVLQGPKLMQKLAQDAEQNGLRGLGLLNSSFGPVKTVLLMHREKKSDSEIQEMARGLGVQVQVFGDLLNGAKPATDDMLPNVGLRDLSTIVYTSGTTGRPKGVMLEHGNLLHQISHRTSPSKPYQEAEPLPGETMVSLLPVWHITERTFELWMAARGCNVVYSSVRSFKNDLAKHKPQWMVLVPRVLEKIALGVQDKFSKGSKIAQTLVKLFTATSGLRATHSKIAKGLVVGEDVPDFLTKLKSRAIVALLTPINAAGDKIVWAKVKDGFGGRLRTIISGGSALAGSLETFYENCGMNIIVGYGLTECSPLLSHRRTDSNLVTAGCAGQPTFDTELRIVDPEAKVNGKERPALPDGAPGLILGRGPQVMRGYYKNAEATAKAIDAFSWFDTGDLGKINPVTGDLILTGRAKDTIVLSNGENIEPTPIEDAIMSESTLIEQIMLTGQDGRRLLAIVVLNPNELVAAGFLEAKDGDILQKANEKVNDPKCTAEDCKEGCDLLNNSSQRLRQSKPLRDALLTDIKRATKGFRQWEQVSDVHITLEPFAMANGLLTQSYKVKRASVSERYNDELEAEHK